MSKFFTSIALLSLSLSAITFSACRQDYDAPPDNSSYDPQLTVTHTIAQLQAMTQGVAIDSNVVVAGIVVMDDESGNYYKSIVIQDSTGGIQVLIDQNSLYNDYPIGRKIYIQCKGLFLGAYGSLIQLGYTPDAGGSISNIPATLIGDFIVKANYPNTVVPDTFTLAQLASPDANKPLLNTLVAVKDAEFADADLGLPYAQLSSLATATNRTVQDCSGGTITLRNSGYAKFQPIIVPGGNGVIVGIYTRYNTTPQLYIRDTSDVRFVNSRCDGSSSNIQTIFTDAFSDLSNWNAVSVTGSEAWSISSSYGSPAPCAIMNGYSGGAKANEDWLITQDPISLNVSGLSTYTLSFVTASKYSGPALECYVSTNYTGTGAPSAASWTLLSATYDNSNAFTWTNSGSVDLSGYNGQSVYIAFKYTSTTSGATTWEVDNVKIVGE
ncbi:MAG: DUF5689 domain-containing protein [Edaphocola sp.]